MVNTGSVIDGVTARVIGLPEQQVWGGSLATFLDSEGNALQLVQYPA